MGAPLWMPLHCADYFKDTRHLSTQEHGAYLLLLMTAWDAGGALPADEGRLARLTGLSAAEWRRSRTVLLDFFTLEGGAYRNKRVDQELAKADRLIELKRLAGKASAAARQRQQVFNGCSTDGATETPTDGQQKGNQSQSQDSEPKGSAPEAPERSIFDEGANLLVSAGTHTNKAARSLVGKWRKQVGEPAVRAAIQDAKGQSISEPAAWIEKRFAAKANGQDDLSASIRRTYGGATAGNA